MASIDIGGIKAAHEKAAPLVTAWMVARNTALQTHSGYVYALKAWTPARDATAGALQKTQAQIDALASDPDIELGDFNGWMKILVPYRDNDIAVLNDLATGKVAILADLAAHLKLSPAAPVSQTIQRGMAPSSGPQRQTAGPILTHKPDGTQTVTENGESVDISPTGEVKSATSPIWYAAAAAAALLLWRLFA
jgi:hypothetical protein